MSHIYGEEGNIGEASGYALGLVNATHFDIELVDTLISASRNNKHDRISRACMASLGLMALGNKSVVLPFYERCIEEKDKELRQGAVNMLGMAYFNTCQNDIISKLL